MKGIRRTLSDRPLAAMRSASIRVAALVLEGAADDAHVRPKTFGQGAERLDQTPPGP